MARLLALTTTAPHAEYFVKLTKGACFGICPVEEYTLYGDGKVVYHGWHYSERPGAHSGRVQLTAATKFFANIAKLDIDQFARQYLSGLVDIQRTSLQFSLDGRQRTVDYDHWSDKAATMIAIEKKLLTLLAEVDWQATVAAANDDKTANAFE